MDRTNLARLSEKKTNPLERYREYVEFQLAIDGEGVGLRQVREKLAQTAAIEGLMELDVFALDSIVVNDYVNIALLQDDPAQPMQKWWWHLGKIRRGEYPVDLLPDSLRMAYSESSMAQTA